MTRRSRSVRFEAELCQGHMRCMRLCPSEAIRVWHGKAQLLPGRCIDCGLCLRACPTNAITPRLDSFTDFGRFRHTVAIPSPAIFSQFGRQVTPVQVLAALKEAGFDQVADISPAIEAVLGQLSHTVHQRSRKRPLISPFCPTVVRLIQGHYPELVEHIAPVEAPQEILAAALREQCASTRGLRREQIGIIYITPCAAQMVGLNLHTRMQMSQLDGAIAVSHIYGHLRSLLSVQKQEYSSQALGNAVSGRGLGWALLGGQGASPEIANAIAVGGLQDVMRTFEDIEKGKLRDVDYIECRSCREGCIDGCLMIENPYESRSKMQQLISQRPANMDADTPVVRELRQRTEIEARPVVPRPPRALDEDMVKALGKMRRLEDLHSRLPQNDCGACGSPTCRAFAEDVVQQRLTEDDCVFLLQRRLRQNVSELNNILNRLPQSPDVPAAKPPDQEPHS